LEINIYSEAHQRTGEFDGGKLLNRNQ